MSTRSLKKKLHPAKKALKRIKDTLQNKLHDLNLPEALKFIKIKTNQILTYCSRRFINPFKNRCITKPPYRNYRNYHHYNHLYQHYSKRNQLQANSPIYIDHLYNSEIGGSSRNVNKITDTHVGTSSRGKEVVNKGEKGASERESKAKEKSLESIEDAWKEVVAKSPQLRPVDERAEEFISNFRQEMKLQKDRSNLEFEERLARSA